MLLLGWVFFRRGDVAGGHHVPKHGPVIFVANHPNGLIDSLVLLWLSPRRVSFLAKSTLFKMPLLGALLRALGALPVYRRQDTEADPAKNNETFEAARALLGQGRALAIFPEGISHSEPFLQPLKTGTARIALQAASAHTPGEPPLCIVPVGFYYTAKSILRSNVLAQFGTPMPVPQVGLDANHAPPPDAVRTLTDSMAEALRAQSLQYHDAATVHLLARAAWVLSEPEAPRSMPLADTLALQQRVAAGAQTLQAKAPERLQEALAALHALDARLRAAGIDENTDLTALAVGRTRLWVRAAWLAPATLPGWLHAPIYYLVRHLARRLSESSDVASSVKLLSGMVLYPVAWALAAGVATWTTGWLAGTAVAIGWPLSGLATLWFLETRDDLRTLRRYRRHAADLATQRESVRRLLLELAQLLDATDGG